MQDDDAGTGALDARAQAALEVDKVSARTATVVGAVQRKLEEAWRAEGSNGRRPIFRASAVQEVVARNAVIDEARKAKLARRAERRAAR